MATSSSSSDWLDRWSPFRCHPQPTAVATTDATTVSDPVHVNQKVEKTFTVSKPADSDASIHQLQVMTPGLTVMRVRPEAFNDKERDVLAKVRVSSDARNHLDDVTVALKSKKSRHSLAVQFKSKEPSKGHLLTEIDVPKESQVQQVVAMTHGDVVVTHDVLCGSPTQPPKGTIAAEPTGSRLAALQNDSPALASLFGARVFLHAPDSDLKLSHLLLGAFGSGSVNFLARSLDVHSEFSSVAIGPGCVRAQTPYFSSAVTSLYTFGSGRASLVTEHAVSTCKLLAHVRCNGSVSARVLGETPVDVASMAARQSIHVSGGGLVDVADVPSVTTKLAISRRHGGHMRLQSPHETLQLRGSSSSRVLGLVQYVGPPPPLVDHINAANPNILLVPLEPEALATIRASETTDSMPVNAPTIESAFETPANLDKAHQQFWKPIDQDVRSLLIFSHGRARMD